MKGARALGKVDRQGKQDGDDDAEPARLACAVVKLVDEQLDTLLDVNDADVCASANVSLGRARRLSESAHAQRPNVSLVMLWAAGMGQCVVDHMSDGAQAHSVTKRV